MLDEQTDNAFETLAARRLSGVAWEHAETQPRKMNIKQLTCVLLFFSALFTVAEPSLSAAPLDELPETSGVWCKRTSVFAISSQHELRLALSLRRITGYAALGFSCDGALIVGDSSGMTGGSAEARRILMRAVCSNAMFVIEDYSGSRSVTFGQAAGERVYDARDGDWSQTWHLRLDFDDFRQMGASSEIKATFDEGFTFFHELLHGLGYTDASSAGELGTCEEIVNRMRGELGLPLRDQYFGQMWRISEKLTSVRLRFRSQAGDGNSTRWKSHYLFFLLTEPTAYSADIPGVTREGGRSRQ